jgi:hypothetical protein
MIDIHIKEIVGVYDDGLFLSLTLIILNKHYNIWYWFNDLIWTLKNDQEFLTDFQCDIEDYKHITKLKEIIDQKINTQKLISDYLKNPDTKLQYEYIYLNNILNDINKNL